MGSPKHLWSGNWEEESAAARRAPVGEPAPAPEPAPPRPAPARPRPRARTPLVRRSMAVGALVLVATLVTATVIALGNSQPSHVTSHARGPAWLGVELRDAPGVGVEIEGVFAGGPAQAAGLFPGDVIVSIDHSSIDSTADVNTTLARLSPGQVVPVGALRGSSSFTAQVMVAAPPSRHGGP